MTSAAVDQQRPSKWAKIVKTKDVPSFVWVAWFWQPMTVLALSFLHFDWLINKGYQNNRWIIFRFDNFSHSGKCDNQVTWHKKMRASCCQNGKLDAITIQMDISPNKDSGRGFHFVTRSFLKNYQGRFDCSFDKWVMLNWQVQKDLKVQDVRFEIFKPEETPSWTRLKIKSFRL